ncbi:hypothetical protein OIU77_008458 [Salix suchowensis]|uniref:Uncharacterized protein n=1 Tax=Salix suchowensis TaxID=1278906 RepID=A0ABQ9AJJ8_9ROSI|nr:hypothetical protein OIU77_008458 [Salix suchowensis]
MTLAKRGGTVTMLDIVTGLKFQEDDHQFSIIVLDRIQQFQGHIFVLDSKIPSNHSRESGDVHNVEQIMGGRSDQFDVSQLHWSLISLSKRSVPEMYNILISSLKYQAALDFANHHGLDRDEVLKSQWLHTDHGKNDINMFLSKIEDHSFVISECVDKSQNLIKGARSGIFEYRKFRVILVSEAAIALAESGKNRCPKPPLQASSLLPGRSPPPRIALREEDWVECEDMVNFINRLPENHEIGVRSELSPSSNCALVIFGRHLVNFLSGTSVELEILIAAVASLTTVSS